MCNRAQNRDFNLLEILPALKNRFPAEGARSATVAGGLNIGLSKFSLDGWFKRKGEQGFMTKSGFWFELLEVGVAELMPSEKYRFMSEFSFGVCCFLCGLSVFVVFAW